MDFFNDLQLPREDEIEMCKSDHILNPGFVHDGTDMNPTYLPLLAREVAKHFPAHQLQ